MRKKLYLVVILLISTFLFIPYVNAGTCSFYISGNSSVNNGGQITLTVGLSQSGTTDGIVNVQGTLSINGSFSFVSFTSLAPKLSPSFNPGTGRFIGVAMAGQGTTGSFSLFRVVVKANSVGTGSVSLTGLGAGDGSGAVLSCNSSTSKTLTSKEPPSTNANLSSLGVTNYNINPAFNTNTTKYSLNVNSNVTSINISANASDPGARLSGTGSRKLNYGSNTISVVVTAAAGNKKNYTITVNRKDDRNTDATLKSLTPSTGKINFRSSTTSYNMEVPFTVSKVTFNAVPNNSKSKASVNVPTLVAGKTVKATVTVTAENGSKKTYNIYIKRGQDPNKPKEPAKDNNLSSLNPSTGTLNPVFSKNVTNYKIVVPFETTTISIQYSLVDSLAKVEKIEPKALEVGSNEFIYTVIATDGGVKEYKVNVIREEDLPEAIKNSTYLKELKLESGKLTKSLNKKETHYFYTGTLKIKETIPESNNAEVEVLTNSEGFYIILLTAPNDDTRVYVFEPKTFNIIPYLIGSGITLALGIIGIKVFKKNKTKKVVKKGKKDDKIKSKK